MCTCKNLAITILFIVITLSCLAQESPYRVEIDMPILDNGAAGGKIYYIDKDTGETIKTIDLLENNPFRNLDLPELTMCMNERNEVNRMFYDLSGTDVSSWLPDMTQYKRYKGDKTIRGQLIQGIHSSINRSNEDCSLGVYNAFLRISVVPQNTYCIITYRLIIGSNGQDYAYISFLEVLNDEGIEDYSIETDDYYIVDAYLSESRDYLIYSFGGGDIDGDVCSSGYKIINLNEETEVASQSIQKGSGALLGELDKNHNYYYFQKYTNGELIHNIHILDFVEMNIKELKLNDSQYKRRKELKTDRLILYRTMDRIPGDEEEVVFSEIETFGRDK